MRTFIIVWFGQLVSTIGSYMTGFAIEIWTWQLTGQVTALALLEFFKLLTSIVISLAAGLIVDRANRKFLMIIGDTVAAVSTLGIIWLYLTGQLQIWHLYVIGAINGAFAEIQALAYSASISMMVPKQHYTRATSMNSAIHYSSIIFAPAIAGILYYSIGFFGILLIDIVTFTVAIATVLKVSIPQPQVYSAHEDQHGKGIFKQIAYGFHYILARPSLFATIAVASLFWFAHDFGNTLFTPMILARTGNDTRVLGSISSASGLGGVTATLLLSIFGGFKHRIHGLLLGMIGAGISKTIFGLGQGLQVWLPAQFCSSLNFPLLSSSNTAILMSKVRPDIQGRVFAAESSIQRVVCAIAILIAGPLADNVFQPAMMPGGVLVPIFGGIFGVGKGAGIALLYVISSVCFILVGISGYALRKVRDVEILVPDHDV
jgi:DHA3 family macrolide efflux protein-like MFS transporter